MRVRLVVLLLSVAKGVVFMYERVKSCFFIGHRDAPDSLRLRLEEVIEQCISKFGITEFVVGQYGNFDRMAAHALVDAKKRHPDITLLLLIPYHPADRPVKAPPGFDGTYYPEGMEAVPKRLAIVRANRYMVDHCDCLIAYVWHPASNARELLEYARRRERKGVLYVENLAEE